VKNNCPLTCSNSLGYINDKISTCIESLKQLYFYEADKVLQFCGNRGSIVFYFSLTIVVTFAKNEYEKVLIRVDVTSEGAEGVCNDTEWWQKKTDVDWTLCSEKTKPETCKELCGVGTGRATPVINGM
jgi:hypothetical protein